MNRKPGRDAFTNTEWKLIQSLRTPARVQRYMSAMPYNWERDGGTMRSFREVVKLNEAHCLEAAIAAAVILDRDDDALGTVEQRDLRFLRTGVLRDVAQRLADDADHRPLDDRLELALRAGLLHLDLQSGLPAKVVDQSP